MKKLLYLFLLITQAAFAQVSVPGIYKVGVSDPKLVLESIFDRTYFVEDSKNVSNTAVTDGQFIGTIPDAKGGAGLVASLTTTPQTQIGKYHVAGGGYLDLDNEHDYYWAQAADLTGTSFPCEYHFTGLLQSVFPSEAYLAVYAIYLADLNGNSLRTVNDDPSIDPTAGWTGVTLPVNKPFQVRMVYNADRSISVYIDGVSLGGSKRTFFTGGTNQIQRLGFGTNTNNAKWFASSSAYKNRLLTTDEATAAYNAFKAKYNTEVNFPYPVAKNVSLDQATNILTANWTYYSPTGVAEDVSKRVYKWYGAGTDSGAPDVTNNHYVPTLDNLQSWSKITYSSLYATDIWWRVDIYCTDVNGLTSNMAAGVQYKKFN